jgi:hypothetical protein
LRLCDFARKNKKENDSQKQKHINRCVGEYCGLQNRFFGAAFGEGGGQRKGHHD